ncbi:MAG: hypothetical protein WEA28_04745 [Xanthobacteraceae bacterium]
MARKPPKREIGDEILDAFKSNSKSYRMLGLITREIIDAVRTDGIQLNAAFEGNRTSQKALNDRLSIILGVKCEKRLNGKLKMVYTNSAAQFFEHNGTARTNFAHMLKKCARAAAAVIDMNAEATKTEVSGALIISGPGVETEFGRKTVTLNEKLIEGMTQKPSYAALAAIALRNRGVVPERGSNTRGIGAIASDDTNLENQCRALVILIREISGVPTRRQNDALKAVRLAISEVIG